MRYLAAAARIAAIGVTAACGGGSGASTEDAHGTRDADAASDAAAGCAGRGCDLACDPAETWVAFTRGVGTGQGDSEPATPDEVGDGLWHLFVGVNLSTTATPDVYIYDLTAASPTDAFAQPASPLVMMRDSYDVLGSETLYTPAGPIETVHVKPRREPQPGVALTAEIWVAPSLQYLPVRILIHQDAQIWVDLRISKLPEQAAK